MLKKHMEALHDGWGYVPTEEMQLIYLTQTPSPATPLTLLFTPPLAQPGPTAPVPASRVLVFS